MATLTLMAPLPHVVLAGQSSITLEAVNPATGAAVSGVKATALTAYGYDVSTVEATTGPEEELPVFIIPFDANELARAAAGLPT